MANSKSGPVTPPTIDLEAKARATTQKPKTTTAKPAAPKKASASSKTPPNKPAATQSKPTPKTATPWIPITAAALGGGVLGLGLSFGLASVGIWPGQTATQSSDMAISQLRDELATEQQDLKKQISELSSVEVPDVSSLEMRIAANETSLQTQASTIPAVQDLSSLEAGISNLQTQLAELSNRMDSVAAGANSDEATRLATTLTNLEEKFQQERGKSANLAETNADMATKIAEIQASIANMDSGPTTNTIPNATQVPLALTGLQTALETGKPFASELAALRAAYPDLMVPNAVTALANKGGVSTQHLTAQFATAIPDMLTAVPAPEQGDWTQTLKQRLFALIALRPAEPQEGTTPEAIFSRLENAVQSADFARAANEFASLPEPMQNAAPDFAKALGQSNTLAAFIESARQLALAPPSSQTTGETTQ